jgi:hypothetical protein
VFDAVSSATCHLCNTRKRAWQLIFKCFNHFHPSTHHHHHHNNTRWARSRGWGGATIHSLSRYVYPRFAHIFNHFQTTSNGMAPTATSGMPRTRHNERVGVNYNNSEQVGIQGTLALLFLFYLTTPISEQRGQRGVHTPSSTLTSTPLSHETRDGEVFHVNTIPPALQDVFNVT